MRKTTGAPGEHQELKKNNEWYTPPKFIDAVYEVMTRIDLDPASCELANQTVGASSYYDKARNGLEQPWHGKVFLNPPFSSEGNKMSQLVWGKKLYREYASGNVQEAIMVLYSTGKNKWLHDLWHLFNGPLAMPYKRLYFLRPTGERIELYFAVYFAYLGKNEQKFTDVFSRFGSVAYLASRHATGLQLALL